MDTNAWIQVQLPSIGRYYGDKCPDGLVEITAWTTAQEEAVIRRSNSPGGGGSIIDDLLTDNVRFPEGFDYEDLLTSDQHFLLMKLRAISVTAVYHINHTCGECKSSRQVMFDIDELPLISPEDDAQWNEPFECTLPRSKKVVGIRHLRVKDSKIISERARQRDNSPALQDDSLVFSLARKMVTVDGKEYPIEEKIQFIRSLIALDFHQLRSFSSRFETGIDTSVRVTCQKCKTVDEFDLPLQSSFFRPGRADLDAAIERAAAN